MRVLLVEDHPGLAKISCDLLRDLYGHNVEHVSNGAAAFAAAMKKIPDLILLDLNLPDMHGYNLAKKIRAESCFERTAIVALTGHGITGNPERSKAAGIDAHFRKPMDFSDLPRIRRLRMESLSQNSLKQRSGGDQQHAEPPLPR